MKKMLNLINVEKINRNNQKSVTGGIDPVTKFRCEATGQTFTNFTKCRNACRLSVCEPLF